MAEIVLAIIILSLLGIVMNFQSLLMPMSMAATFSIALVLAFFLFIVFIFREKPKDEREHFHKLMAGRMAFITGALILIAGIIYQTFMHNIDPWLIYTLSGMILTKLLIVTYQRYKM
jgi:heme/copper-type cytochrome/quinol oxidase subunit 2